MCRMLLLNEWSNRSIMMCSILLLNERDVGILLHGMQHSSIPQMMELKCIRREASKIIVCKGVDALLLHDDYA